MASRDAAAKQLGLDSSSETEDLTPRATVTDSDPAVDSKKDAKAKRRNLFSLGKKKADGSTNDDTSTFSAPKMSKDSSKLSSTSYVSSTPPHQLEPSFMTPTSPAFGMTTTGSRVGSPAGSQIFERHVQDESILPPNSPAIPTHIQTEHHIPAVLDDASEAITNKKLDPDAVEIVTHTSHLPAAVTVTGTNVTSSQDHGWAQELESFTSRRTTGIAATSPDTASNYGSLDSADVRRLSFISFADVVQAEHGMPSNVAGSRDSMYLAGMSTLPTSGLNRSPSPVRSPVSSQGPGTSPPTSNPSSIKGMDLSPTRKPLGSPTTATHQPLAAPGTGGELNIETMSQALRKTASSDLNQFRSFPTSPIDPPTAH